MGIGFVLSFLVLCCTDFPTVAGGTTGSGNAFVEGQLLAENGHVLSKASVVFVPEDYDPSEKSQKPLQKIFTDEQGNFSILLDTGVYNIELESHSRKYKKRMTSVVISEERNQLGNMVLRPLGSIRLDAKKITQGREGVLYGEGSQLAWALFGQAALDSALELHNLPEGRLPTMFWKEKDQVAQKVYQGSHFTVTPGKVLSLENNEWVTKKEEKQNESGVKTTNVIIDYRNFIHYVDTIYSKYGEEPEPQQSTVFKEGYSSIFDNSILRDIGMFHSPWREHISTKDNPIVHELTVVFRESLVIDSITIVNRNEIKNGIMHEGRLEHAEGELSLNDYLHTGIEASWGIPVNGITTNYITLYWDKSFGGYASLGEMIVYGKVYLQ